MRQATDLHSMLHDPVKWGNMTMTHKDNFVLGIAVDRIAHAGTTLYLLSCVAPAGKVKAMRAIMHAQFGVPHIHTDNLSSAFPSSPALYGSVGELRVHEGGYTCRMEKLDYGLVYVVFIAKAPAFMTYLDSDTLWLKLKTDLYTTPLIPEWMPYVSREMIARKYLRECRCFRCNCGLLEISSDAKLDEIVIEGIKSGAISIPDTQ